MSSEPSVPDAPARDAPARDAFTEEVPHAFERWAQTVFSAPRHPRDLITEVRTCDEVVERLATLVIRRELHEVRTGTRERRSTASRLRASAVDPFAFTPETLRVESQYIAQCDACAASGMTPCQACRGGCTVACPSCRGTGKERSEKTGKPINCKRCKKSGRIPCGACTATGSVSCRACAGSGHELAWLAFKEAQRWSVALSPRHSPIVLAHEPLREARPLGHDELSEFSIVEEHHRDGPLELGGHGDPHRQLPRAQREEVDRRLERIAAQQYLRIAIVRRDVTYEMCGARGTVVLSGKTLLGAATEDAVRPIRRRLVAWPALVCAVAVIGALLRAAFVGSSSYFDGAKQASGLLVAGAVACAVPALGALLRAWRGGARLRKLSRPTLAAGGGIALALLGVVGVGLAVRPGADELQAALAADDPIRARVVLEALKERATGGEALDLEDRVVLAEAGKQLGQDRLKLLDRVASGKRAASASAAAAARTERLSQVRSLVQAKDARNALAALDEWFRDDRSVDVSEERARAHEVRGAACKIDPCRWAAAVNASAARETNERAAQVASSRARVWDSLATEQVSERSIVPRLQQARQLVERATEVLEAAVNDAEVSARASAAVAFGQAERRKVPLIGMDLDIAKELLGPASTSETGVPRFSLEGVAAYAAVDKAGKCTGLFVIGDSPPDRVLRSSTWSAERILSQALGRPTAIRAASAPTSQWYEGGVPIVVRWRAGEVVELRIGDATP